MKRVSKILLLGVLLAFNAAMAGFTQDAVSIIGINTSLVGDSVVIEIQTTRPADFELDRADGASWVFLWCDGFVLDNTMEDIPIDFGIAAFDGLVEGAALAASGRKSGISISLGPNADIDRAFVVNAENFSTLTIPAVSALSSDKVRENLTNSLSGPAFIADNNDQAEGAGFEIQSVSGRAIEVPVTNLEESQLYFGDARATELAPVEEIEVAPIVIAQPAAMQEQPEAKPIEPVKSNKYQPAKLQWGETEGSRFLMPGMVGPRMESTDVVLTERVEPSFREVTPEDYDPIPNFDADPAIAMGSSNTPGLGQDAEINYQALRQDAPDDGSGTGQAELDEALEKVAEELMKNFGNVDGGQSEGGTTIGAFSTSSSDSYAQFQSQALLSDNGHIERGLSKDDLGNIRIEDFKVVDTPLDQAITLLVAPTDFNVIVDGDVSANKISLSFKDKQTNLKSALDLITKVYGLRYVVEAGTIVVASKEKMADSLLAASPRMFVLSYADPTSVKNILINTGLVDEKKVEVYTGETEVPTINDSTALSAETEVGGQEVKLIESNLSSSPRNVLLVMAPDEEMVVIAKVIADLDRKPKLIELEVRVCEASENAMRDLGLEINSNQSTPSPTVTLFTEPSTIDDDGNFLNESNALESFKRSPLGMLVTLNTLVQDGEVEILAQPTLTTVDGKQAIFFAGERIPYISTVSQTQTGTQIEVDFLNVGITLNFKPRIDKDGKLTIDVNPIVSSLLEFRIIGQLIEAPRTSSRQMATTVRVESGEPFVLAGLISETERTTITKIPLLGDLPLVGKLFRNKNHKGERTEIIVVVTPVVYD